MIAMQIAHDRFEPHDSLAIQRDSHAQHAVSGWVVWSQVDDDMVSPHPAFFILQCMALKGCVKILFLVNDVFFRVKALGEVEIVMEYILFFREGMFALRPTALVGFDFLFVESFLPILAERVTFKSFPHQDAAQVRMACKLDAEQVPCFTFLVFKSVPDVC
jgi:hypothetical protein